MKNKTPAALCCSKKNSGKRVAEGQVNIGNELQKKKEVKVNVKKKLVNTVKKVNW